MNSPMEASPSTATAHRMPTTAQLATAPADLDISTVSTLRPTVLRTWPHADGMTPPGRAGPDARDWDDRYAGRDLVWGAEPNRFVAEALADRPAGRALDVACGEGRNALWLASRGWSATGVDFSSVAVDRARRLAGEAGLADRTTFDVVDVVAEPLPGGPFDAVVVAYLQLPAAQRATALAKAAAVVAPGGLLVVVAHDRANLERGVGGPQDPSVLFSPQDVVADVAAERLVVERAEVVRRPVPTDEGTRDALDALVVARRGE